MGKMFHAEQKGRYLIITVLGVRFKIRRKKNRKGIIFVPLPKVKQVGRCTYCREDTHIDTKETKIGSFCSIGERVVLGHGNHPLNFLSTSPFLYFDMLGYKNKEMVSHEEYWGIQPITIGNDVWIGDGAFVKNGITIGDGAVIGARSVVTHDVPPYAIVCGSPARIVRYRFDPKTISELLELKWWDLDDDVIKKIPYDNIEEAIQFLKKHRKKSA